MAAKMISCRVVSLTAGVGSWQSPNDQSLLPPFLLAPHRLGQNRFEDGLKRAAVVV